MGRVAPPAGAWIETSMGERLAVYLAVAPPAGAWIETVCHGQPSRRFRVAPPAGAWIETDIAISIPFIDSRRASRRRVD